ncbi:glutamine amidotransferase [Alkalispirochaeta sphaeroplastigenens]|uniref:Glutamine amidotransferase n=1 Tax=Alkalispirochaeta sphaeroplastigenens TaxID=1187066 RepID=A0A2S4JX72_9SPIO|nr:type 1 glutamine amidotransferase domain-containing protein [Alkalispirochaeta sphaeroplastigenens]POR04122.1 glutamine amidotransferase [Alkalispirochaeta sphaeroplastigenens]
MVVASLIHHDFEDLEFWYPTLRLQEAGHTVHILGERPRETWQGKYGVPAESTHSFEEVSADDYDMLLVPGGWAPDKLRRFPAVLDLVRAMNDSGKIIGQICHAGWVLASAGILQGRTVTSTPGIRDDMTNAGAIWVDKPVVVEGNLVSSRRPPDLPHYGKALVEALSGR